MNKVVLSIAFALVIPSCNTNTQTYSLSAEETRQIAREAYIFSYPMLMGYQAPYYTSNPMSPGYRGSLNQISHDIKPADHKRKDVVTSQTK